MPKQSPIPKDKRDLTFWASHYAKCDTATGGQACSGAIQAAEAVSHYIGNIVGKDLVRQVTKKFLWIYTKRYRDYLSQYRKINPKVKFKDYIEFIHYVFPDQPKAEPIVEEAIKLIKEPDGRTDTGTGPTKDSDPTEVSLDVDSPRS